MIRVNRGVDESAQKSQIIANGLLGLCVSAKVYFHCSGCARAFTIGELKEQREMAGAFAAFKVRDNMNNDGNHTSGQQQQHQQEPLAGKSTTEDLYSHPPAKYNEKLMMSIWGLYNRYSVHNMKSHKGFDKA